LGESIRRFRESSIKRSKIPTGRLKAGENILTIEFKIDSNATRHVMDDYVNLELW